MFSIPLQAILAAVVIANLIGLLRQFSRLRDLWRIHKPDAVRWISNENSLFIFSCKIERVQEKQIAKEAFSDNLVPKAFPV